MLRSLTEAVLSAAVLFFLICAAYLLVVALGLPGWVSIGLVGGVILLWPRGR